MEIDVFEGWIWEVLFFPIPIKVLKNDFASENILSMILVVFICQLIATIHGKMVLKLNSNIFLHIHLLHPNIFKIVNIC